MFLSPQIYLFQILEKQRPSNMLLSFFFLIIITASSLVLTKKRMKGYRLYRPELPGFSSELCDYITVLMSQRGLELVL